MDVPGYEVPECGVLIDLTISIPLLKIENASGRLTSRPWRKVATFLFTDGPLSTLRKARTKRAEPKFTGDFRTSLVLGTVIPSGVHAVALAPRVPPCSQQLVVHRDLVNAVREDFAAPDLLQVAARLADRADVLRSSARQTFLYSGMAPPVELTKLVKLALSETADGSPAIERPLRALAAPPARDGRAADPVLRCRADPRPARLRAAVLGGGDYTRTEIIPALRRARIPLHSVSNREPHIAAMIGRQHGSVLATTDSGRAIAELPAPGLVIIATAHDSHADLACQALRAGHRVFIEKPPVVTAEDVHRLTAMMRRFPGMAEIGFNRRYHPLVRRARALLRQESGPTSICCIVKELAFEADHWYFWPNQGTRITGNLCHWIDLAVYLLADEPMPVSVSLSPRIPGSAVGSDEERVLSVTFDDGSLLTILATTRGDDVRGVQELIELRRGRRTIFIDDLWKMRVRSGGIDRRYRTMYRNKAHAVMYREALGRATAGQSSVYPVHDMIVVSAIQIAASDLAKTDKPTSHLPDWLLSKNA